MDLPLSLSSGLCQLRSIIRFLLAKKCEAPEIIERIKIIYGEDAVKDRTVSLVQIV